MTDTSFDASGFVRFELSQGSIRSPQNHLMTLLPLEMIAALAPTPSLRSAAIAWGQAQASSLAPTVQDANLTDLARHLQTGISLMGLGQIRIELFGRALVLRMHPPDISFSGTLKVVVEGFLSGFLSTLTPGRLFEVITMTDSTEQLLFFAGNETTAGNVRVWIEEGTDALSCMERLNREGGQP